MSLARRLLLVLLLAWAAVPACAVASDRVIVSPGLSELPLSPHVGYLVDPDGRADATAMF